MEKRSTHPQWFVIQSKPRQEAEAERQIQQQGFIVYLPRLKTNKLRAGRWVDVIEPLFPRYLFVHLDPQVDSIAPLRSTRGVSNIVRFGQQLCAVPDSVIKFLQQQEDPASGCYHPLLPELKKGDEVVIRDGPFAGMRGIFERVSGEERVIVLLDCLGKQNRIDLARGSVLAGGVY